MDGTRFDFSLDFEDEIDDAEEEEEEEEDGWGMTSPTRELMDGTPSGGKRKEDTDVKSNLFGSLFPGLSLTSPSSGLTSPSHSSLTGLSPGLTSPSRPSYSLCGARLRWGNTGQVLSFSLSPSPSHSPSPSRDVTEYIDSDCTDSLSVSPLDSPLVSPEPQQTTPACFNSAIEEPIFASPTQYAYITAEAISSNLFEFMSSPSCEATEQIIEPLSVSPVLQQTTKSPKPNEKTNVIDFTDSLSVSPLLSPEPQQTTPTSINIAIEEPILFPSPAQSTDTAAAFSSNLFEFMTSPNRDVIDQMIEPLSISPVLQQATKSTSARAEPFEISPTQATNTCENVEPVVRLPKQTTEYASANAEPFVTSPKQTTKYASTNAEPLATLPKQTTIIASTNAEPLLAAPTQTTTAATATTCTQNSCAEAKCEQCCHRNHSEHTASHNFAFALSVANFPLDASRRQKLSRSVCEDPDRPRKANDKKFIRDDAVDYSGLDIAKGSSPSCANSDLSPSSDGGINWSFGDSHLLSQSERDSALPSESSREGGESNSSSTSSSTRRGDNIFSSSLSSESDFASPNAGACNSSSSNRGDYIISSPSACGSEGHPSSPNHPSNINLKSDFDDLINTIEKSASSAERFVSNLDIVIDIMPVPESFTSSWSIKHEPALHMAADRLKKYLADKDLITRDDNHNIEEFEEVTETEVPASRLYSGLKNGNNGVHHPTERLRFTDGDEEDQEHPLRSAPDNIRYSESVSVCRVPAQVNYREGVRCDIDDSRHHRSEVRMVPGGPPEPGRYYSTMTQCFINSKYRRYKETVFVTLNAPNAKQYTTSVFIFPKSSRETFVSEVEHLPEERIKWYKSCVNMEARDYVSVKFLQVN